METKGLARPLVDRAIDVINSFQLTVQIQITSYDQVKIGVIWNEHKKTKTTVAAYQA